MNRPSHIHWVFLTTLCLCLLLGATAMRGSPQNAQGANAGQPTRLTVQPMVTAPQGATATIAARLTTTKGKPVAAAELLFADSNGPLASLRTDANGMGVWQAPPDLAAGVYDLKIVFGGTAAFGATIAVTRLEIQPTAPKITAIDPLLFSTLVTKTEQIFLNGVLASGNALTNLVDLAKKFNVAAPMAPKDESVPINSTAVASRYLPPEAPALVLPQDAIQNKPLIGGERQLPQTGVAAVSQMEPGVKAGARKPAGLSTMANPPSAVALPGAQPVTGQTLPTWLLMQTDAQMRTSDPHIFAAGDVAEFEGKLYGLWPVAVSQAEVAAANAVAAPGADLAAYEEAPPVTMLKVVGVDLTSMGRIHPQSDGEMVIALEDSVEQRYRKLIIADGKIVGAILLGYPQVAPGVTAAVKAQTDITPYLTALQAGDWEALSALAG